MPYTSNPYVHTARMRARNDVVWRGLSCSQAANKYGVNRSTIWRWVKRAKRMKLSGNSYIWTTSSRPHHHPRQLPQKTVNAVVKLRKETGRCAQVLHVALTRRGVQVSLSSVKRILKRHHLTRRKKRNIRRYTRFPRPQSTHPGALVQMDTIHYVTIDYHRFFVYAVIDTYSRLGYAEYQPRFTTERSISVLKRAMIFFGFPVEVVQTDNGPEFSEFLFDELQRRNIRLRHSRVRRPNDNAHVERFIRTIQEECFHRMLPNPKTANQKLAAYIRYYNTERIHLGIQCKTPTEMLQRS